MDKLATSFDEASADLHKAISFDSDLAKAAHDAMFHHALHAAAASRAGKTEEAAKHTFMHMRHALENVRGKDSYGMRDAMQRNITHYSNEAHDELNSPEYQRGYGQDDHKKKKHKLVKHFEEGGGFASHPSDKGFEEDYKASKGGPKLSKGTWIGTPSSTSSGVIKPTLKSDDDEDEPKKKRKAAPKAASACMKSLGTWLAKNK